MQALPQLRDDPQDALRELEEEYLQMRLDGTAGEVSQSGALLPLHGLLLAMFSVGRELSCGFAPVNRARLDSSTASCSEGSAVSCAGTFHLLQA